MLVKCFTSKASLSFLGPQESGFMYPAFIPSLLKSLTKPAATTVLPQPVSVPDLGRLPGGDLRRRLHHRGLRRHRHRRPVLPRLLDRFPGADDRRRWPGRGCSGSPDLARRQAAGATGKCHGRDRDRVRADQSVSGDVDLHVNVAIARPVNREWRASPRAFSARHCLIKLPNKRRNCRIPLSDPG